MQRIIPSSRLLQGLGIDADGLNLKGSVLGRISKTSTSMRRVEVEVVTSEGGAESGDAGEASAVETTGATGKKQVKVLEFVEHPDGYVLKEDNASEKSVSDVSVLRGKHGQTALQVDAAGEVSK